MRLISLYFLCVFLSISHVNLAKACQEIAFDTAVEQEHLWFVHSIDFSSEVFQKNFAHDGTELYIESSDVAALPIKYTLNHFFNGLVVPFRGGDTWDCQKYILVESTKHFVGEMIGGLRGDFVTIMQHKWGPESYLLVPENEVGAIKKKYPGYEGKIVGYPFPPALNVTNQQCTDALAHYKDLNNKYLTPRQSVARLFETIKKEKGLDIWKSNIVIDENNWPREGTPPNLLTDKDQCPHDLGIMLNKKFTVQNVSPDGMRTEDIKNFSADCRLSTYSPGLKGCHAALADSTHKNIDSYSKSFLGKNYLIYQWLLELLAQDFVQSNPKILKVLSKAESTMRFQIFAWLLLEHDFSKGRNINFTSIKDLLYRLYKEEATNVMSTLDALHEQYVDVKVWGEDFEEAAWQQKWSDLDSSLEVMNNKFQKLCGSAPNSKCFAPQK